MKKVLLTLFLIFSMTALMSQHLRSEWIGCEDLGCEFGNNEKCEAISSWDCSSPGGGGIECVSGYTILCHSD